MDQTYVRSFFVGRCLIAVGLFFATVVGIEVRADEKAWPTEKWEVASPADVDLDEGKLHQARDYALTAGGSGYVVRGGKLVLAWGDPAKRYDLKSTTKSIGVTALGLAIADGKITLLDPAVRHHPSLGVPPESNAKTGWIERITIRDLATQTAGFAKPGGFEELKHEPGTTWAYSDGGPNWLAECVTLAYRRDVDELMFERVFEPIGIDRKDLVWRKNGYRPEKIEGIARREFGSGVSANVDAMARLGLLYLRGGEWNGRRILHEEFVETARQPVPSVVGLPEAPGDHGNASSHYGLLWWNNADGTLPDVPRDAYWSWGLYDSLIVVIPSLDLVVSRAGESWKRESDAHYDVLKPFLGPIVAAARTGPNAGAPPTESGAAKRRSPYPPSPVIARVEWAPVESIVRRAKGSDNWPLTWGDDDALYGAYGDGRGFDPFVERKLSLGLARIEGGPDDFVATNLRAGSIEALGDGERGTKASGMLMAGGVLYLFARNVGNSQLAWSEDRGETWTWTDWKFEESFGCPTFLNFGSDYDGARDRFVYVYSHDSDSAYRPADRMVLARAPVDRLREREAYEFFAGLDQSGEPIWKRDISERNAVFVDPARCYRSSISYDAGLGRYLWCHTLPGEDPRFRGGLAIYDAPHPWGPWTTPYFAQTWDVGPGETSSLPTKWMSEDGRTVHLVFSGDDCFSVRRAKLVLASEVGGGR